MSWNDTYIFWNVETSNNSFLFQVMSINNLFNQEYMDVLQQKVDYLEHIGEVSMGNFYMFITPNLIDNNTTLTTFEALGNLKSQTPKLSHTLI
jgi:predicted metalloprotease